VLVEVLSCVLLMITFQKGFYNLALLILAAATVIVISAGSAATNDYFDRESDSLTHPERPIPSGQVSPAGVAQFAALTFLIGLGLSLMINPVAFGIVAGNVVLFILYPRVFKRLSGFMSNLVMGYLGATVALFAGAVIFQTFNVDTLSFVGMIAVAVIGFNVLKDALTLEGDVKIGYPTLAVKRGIRTTAIVGALFLLFTAISLPVPYLVGVVGVVYLFPVAVAACVFLFSSFSLLRESNVQNIRRRLRISTLCWSVLPIALIINALFSYTW